MKVDMPLNKETKPNLFVLFQRLSIEIILSYNKKVTLFKSNLNLNFKLKFKHCHQIDVFPTLLHEQDVTLSQCFKQNLRDFKFKVFILLDWFPYQGQRAQSALLFTHSWRENSWMHTFPRGVSAI